MRTIEAILFEPVGCLAEFPSEEFNEIALRLFDRKPRPRKSASGLYWHLLTLMQAAAATLSESERKAVEALELQAVEGASVYEDVVPALAELKAMGMRHVLTSSLSEAAVTRFLEKFFLTDFFSEVWSRDKAEGVKVVPLVKAIISGSFKPPHVMFLTDTAEGLKAAKEAGVNPILMMNDPDEAMDLALQEPAGGIVSLHELPDFVRLVAAENEKAPR